MAEPINPDEYTKPELIDLAKGTVSTDGTKAEIADRLNGYLGDAPAPDLAPPTDVELEEFTNTQDAFEKANHEADAEQAILRERNDRAKAAEQEAKEGGLPRNDTRDSVFDSSPNKSAMDQLAQKAAKQEADADVLPKPQYFVVTDELVLDTVVGKLGLFDAQELATLNGLYAGHRNLTEGQRILLPAHYRFDGVDGVE